MDNKFVKMLLDDVRKEQEIQGGWSYISTDCTDTVPFSSFLARVAVGELKDETFDFEELSTHATRLYALFLTVDKLGGAVNKAVIRLILQIEKFIALKTQEKGVSLVQSMLGHMIMQFLGNTLTAKPIDAQTKKTVVFDEGDKGKDYSDKYFSFAHNSKRYTVKTDTFDLSDILGQL